MPAHKKHSSTRKRRNRASTAATLTLVPEPAEDDIDWNTLTVPHLRAELAHRELPTKGRKADLVARLQADDIVPDTPTLPDLPKRWDSASESWVTGSWHSEVVRWWDDVWNSPMSEEWHLETDYHNLVIGAVHLNDFWQAEEPAARQKADAAFKKTITPALGLTPYDRRRLEWTIASAGEATDRRNRRRGATPIGDGAAPPARVDPRAALAGAPT